MGPHSVSHSAQLPLFLTTGTWLLWVVLAGARPAHGQAPGSPPSVSAPSGSIQLGVRGGVSWSIPSDSGQARSAYGMAQLRWVTAPERPYTAPSEAPPPLPPRPASTFSRQVIAAAVAAHWSAAQSKELSAMKSRARYAAALPDVRLRAGTSADQSLRFAPTLTDPARYSRDGGQDLWLDAQLSWRLDRAAFAHEEVAIERLRTTAAREQAQHVQRALRALHRFRRAQKQLEDPLLEPERLQNAEIGLLEASAELDALTDGWFSLHVPAAQASGRIACSPAEPALQGAHAIGNPERIGGPQKARGCAKGASLTSLDWNGSSKSWTNCPASPASGTTRARLKAF